MRKVDVKLPGEGNSNLYGARSVHLIIAMIKWIRTSRLSIKNSLPTAVSLAGEAKEGETPGTFFLSLLLSSLESSDTQVYEP